MSTRPISRSVIFCLATAIVSLANAGGNQAEASIVTPNPGLPPDQGFYATIPPTQVVEFVIDGFDIKLTYIKHDTFANIVVTPVGPDEHEHFDSTLTGFASINGGSNTPFTLAGPVDVTAFGKAGQTTGTFPTEITSMDMTGTILGHSVELIESPTLASTGSTTITDIGGGLFRISSFFDVFTELSIDSSPFSPQTDGAHHVELIIPEPSTWILGLSALLIVPAYGRWRRRRA